MEFKKKTIIWEDNNEPPKDYIWIKSDGKAYEFDNNTRTWKESSTIAKLSNSESSTGLTGNLLDDWVNAITQGEYTKYEDVPDGDFGYNEGWTTHEYVYFDMTGEHAEYYDDDNNLYSIAKNATYYSLETEE